MFRRTKASLLSMMAWTFFAAATLLPTTASAAGYGVSSADALAIALVSSGSLLVLLGMCGSLFLSQREQLSVPEYPAPLHVPELENISAVRPPNCESVSMSRRGRMAMEFGWPRVRLGLASQAARANVAPHRGCCPQTTIAHRHGPARRMNRSAWLRRQPSDLSGFLPRIFVS